MTGYSRWHRNGHRQRLYRDEGHGGGRLELVRRNDLGRSDEPSQKGRQYGRILRLRGVLRAAGFGYPHLGNKHYDLNDLIRRQIGLQKELGEAKKRMDKGIPEAQEGIRRRQNYEEGMEMLARMNPKEEWRWDNLMRSFSSYDDIDLRMVTYPPKIGETVASPLRELIQTVSRDYYEDGTVLLYKNKDALRLLGIDNADDIDFDIIARVYDDNRIIPDNLEELAEVEKLWRSLRLNSTFQFFRKN